MLVLTRKVGEGIVIDDHIKIIVMQIKGRQVRIGIKAQNNTSVHREEIYQKIKEENDRAKDSDQDTIQKVAGLFHDQSAYPQKLFIKEQTVSAKPSGFKLRKKDSDD